MSSTIALPSSFCKALEDASVTHYQGFKRAPDTISMSCKMAERLRVGDGDVISPHGLLVELVPCQKSIYVSSVKRPEDAVEVKWE